MYVFGRSGTPKNARANEAIPLDANIADLSSITCRLWIPPYIFITAGKGPGPET